MNRSILFSFSLLFILTPAFAQLKRSSHWYMGHKAGIDFSSGTAVADTNGKLASIEGASSVSDLLGNLLFYSDGVTVWDRFHEVMPNGTGLAGDNSSVQSSLIVQLPVAAGKYYLFTTKAATNFCYSEIDLSLNGGAGDVTAIKNSPLHPNGTEELAGTLHCNKTDYWIVSRRMAEDTLCFYAYRITANGVQPPVMSTFNTPNSYLNAVGNLTFSQNGDLLCFTSFDTNLFLFDFDQQSGELTLREQIERLPNETVYCNALSPTGNRLYITSWANQGQCRLSQFDLLAPDIAASRVELDSVDFNSGSPNGYGFIGQVRLAPDQRIYISRWHQNAPYSVNPESMYSLDSLDVIELPENNGLACDYHRNALYLEGRPTMIGLPCFVSTYTAETVNIPDCIGNIGLTEQSPGNIAVFPNPVEHELTIENTERQRISIRLLDSQGKVLESLSSVEEFIRMDVSSRAVGLYLLEISTETSRQLLRISKY